MYLDLLKQIVQISTEWESAWPKLAAMRKELATAVADPDIDTTEVSKYVSTSNRLSKLNNPAINELKLRIDTKAQAVFDSRSENIYAAQLEWQLADEKLAALLTDEELTQMHKDLDNLILANANSTPELTRSLIMRKGTRLAITALRGDS